MTRPSGIAIRPAEARDMPEILRLNAEWEHVTSPLDGAALAHLHSNSAYHRVAEVGASIAAFLLALGPGVDYPSPNYRWFDDGSTGFLYIDRIVVSGDHQRAGLGDALYDDLFAFARRERLVRLVCEVDAEPLNAASDAFHARRGFTEVATQVIGGGAKRVSLRECRL